MAPLVSIIVAAYNAERFLAATVESALAQDWPSCEVIVVDDGSKDGTLSVIRAYETRGVIAIARANGGGPAARNTGFAASRGAFVQFLDHDDLLAPDKISRQMSCAAGDDVPIAGVWTRFRGDVAGAYGGWQPPANARRDAAPLEWLVASPVVPTCAWLTPRRLVEAAGLWNESLKANPDDDGEFFMRVIDNAARVVFCDQARSYFRAEGIESAGHNRSRDALRSVFAICQSFEEIVRRRGLTAGSRQAAANRYLAFMYMAYPECAELITQAEARVAALGFDPSRVPNTPIYESLSRMIGWRTAKRLQRAWQTARQTVSGRAASRH